MTFRLWEVLVLWAAMLTSMFVASVLTARTYNRIHATAKPITAKDIEDEYSTTYPERRVD